MKITAGQPVHRRQFNQEKIGWLDNLLISNQKDKPGFNRRMFDEDFARIFRYSHHRSGNLFKVETNDQELSARLLGNIKTRHTSRAVDKTIHKLIEDIVQSLVWFGKAYYFLHDNNENNETHISSFSPARVFSLFGLHFQYLPKRSESYLDEKDRDLPREIRYLKKAKVLYFKIPKTIKRILYSQNKCLAAIDKYHGIGSSFLIQATHENPSPQNHFDFRVWREVEDQALYRATQRTGWNGRKHDVTKKSNFFDCFRLIRFRRNQLELRDSVLKQLSGELSRVGCYYKPYFYINISPSENLPSVRELDALEIKLALEEVGFSEIIDFCFKR